MKNFGTIPTVASVLLLFGLRGVSAQRPLGMCGDCWCIPGEGEICPFEDKPVTEFSAEWLANLNTMTLENPILLNCDIYNDPDCDTWPPLEQGEACVAEIIASADGSMTCPQGFSYRLKTVASRWEAERNLEFVTHDGACGTCSTFQDLAVYQSSQDLVTVGVQCALRAVSNNFTDGFNCYKDAGFTDACATTWLYNSIHTNANCQSNCTSHIITNAPPNLGVDQNCDLADCILCDELRSGPAFKKFAGRTRRRSGLLSAIVRPCADVGTVAQIDPCDYDTLTKPPTTAPSLSMTPTTSPIGSEDSASSPDDDDSGSSRPMVSALFLAMPLMGQITIWLL